jgi:hypothetical protein
VSNPRPDQQLESAIYKGFVRHRRFTPQRHEFDYPLFMMLLKLDEIPDLLQRFWQLGSRMWSWARFRRADYLGSADEDLADAVRCKIATLADLAEHDCRGDVYLLCHLRYFGIYFSPLNLYYLKQDGQFRFMLAEVSNTPWNQRHYYLVDLEQPVPHAKAFHVSPFNPMQQTYQWRITPPDAESGQCLVHIAVQDQASRNTVFDATLSLKRLGLNQALLNRVLLKTPIQTASVVVGIYWQALKLFVKKVPLHKHPGKAATSVEISKEGNL